MLTDILLLLIIGLLLWRLFWSPRAENGRAPRPEFDSNRELTDAHLARLAEIAAALRELRSVLADANIEGMHGDRESLEASRETAQAILDIYNESRNSHRELSSQLDNVRRGLERLAHTLIEIDENTTTSELREKRKFSRATPLTVTDLRSMAPGSVHMLISARVGYPNDEHFVDTFFYEHGGVEEQSTSEMGFLVRGRAGRSPHQEDFTFYANGEQATTIGGCGEIRLLW